MKKALFFAAALSVALLSTVASQCIFKKYSIIMFLQMLNLAILIKLALFVWYGDQDPGRETCKFVSTVSGAGSVEIPLVLIMQGLSVNS